MIYGIVASEFEQSFSAGAPDVLAFTDFVNGVYQIGGITKSASDIIDQPAKIGASGLEIISDNSGGNIAAINDLLAALIACDWTIVLEVNLLDVASGHESNFLVIQKTDVGEFFQASYSDAFIVEDDNVTGDRYLYDDSWTSATAGIHKLAITRIGTKIAASIDGGTVISDTTDIGGLSNVTVAQFGGWYGDNSNKGFYLRSLTIYSPVSDLALPVLSA